MQLTIRQVTLKKVIITPSGQDAKLAFPYTTAFARKMGWYEELPEMTGTWSPDAPHNRLAVRVIEFKPTDPATAGHAFTLECHGHMESFAVVRKAAKKGKDSIKTGQKKTDITCTVAFMDEQGAANLTAYMRAVPTSSITVTYDPTPVQEDLPEATVEQPELIDSETADEPAEQPEVPVTEQPKPKRSHHKKKPAAE